MSSNVRPLIATEQIETAVAQLGRDISRDYADKSLTILAILAGSIVFVADLMRQITLPHQLGLVQASSYRGTATTPGTLRINAEFLPNLRGRDVLLVDDILDTGQTLSGIIKLVEQLEPSSIRTAVLLWKQERTRVALEPDYVCFDIPDQFVVGYGLDHNGEHRHLPYIGIVESTESKNLV